MTGSWWRYGRRLCNPPFKTSCQLQQARLANKAEYLEIIRTEGLSCILQAAGNDLALAALLELNSRHQGCKLQRPYCSHPQSRHPHFRSQNGSNQSNRHVLGQDRQQLEPTPIQPLKTSRRAPALRPRPKTARSKKQARLNSLRVMEASRRPQPPPRLSPPQPPPPRAPPRNLHPRPNRQLRPQTPIPRRTRRPGPGPSAEHESPHLHRLTPNVQTGLQRSRAPSRRCERAHPLVRRLHRTHLPDPARGSSLLRADGAVAARRSAARAHLRRARAPAVAESGRVPVAQRVGGTGLPAPPRVFPFPPQRRLRPGASARHGRADGARRAPPARTHRHHPPPYVELALVRRQ